MCPHVDTFLDLKDPSHAVVQKIFWYFLAKHYSEPFAPNISNDSFCRILIMTLRFDYLEINSLFSHFFHKCWLSSYLIWWYIHCETFRNSKFWQKTWSASPTFSLYPSDKLQQSRRCLQTPGHTYCLLFTWCKHVKYRYASLLEDEVGDTVDGIYRFSITTK